MTDHRQLLAHLYARFNARDIDGVLADLHDDVAWANGMDGGHVHGHDAIRQYWTHQWSVVDPRVEPLGFTPNPDGSTLVQVRQTVRDLAGLVLQDHVVGHVFHVRDGRIVRFDIEDAERARVPQPPTTDLSRS